MADDPREADPMVVSNDDPNSFAEFLQEIRILLQGAQLLAGFLIVLPFSERFSTIVQAEKSVYLATFLCTMTSLILFSTPAIHHRLQRPLVNRIQFKNMASRMMIAGTVPLSVALVLATQLATSEVLGEWHAGFVAACVGAVVVLVWWVLPFVFRNRRPPPLRAGTRVVRTLAGAVQRKPRIARRRPRLRRGGIVIRVRHRAV